MTDEIIKAEKVIKDLHAYCFCSQSVFKEMGYSFTETDFDYLNNLIYLINNKNAEIERLNEKITTKDESNYYFMGQLRTAREELQTAKHEAVKEFAERLKKIAKDNCLYQTGVIYETVNLVEIDNLVKEMTEVSEK